MKIASEHDREYQTRLNPPPWVPRHEAPSAGVTYTTPEVLELKVAEPSDGGSFEEASNSPSNDSGGFERYVTTDAEPLVRPANDDLQKIIEFLATNPGAHSKAEILDALELAGEQWNRLRPQIEGHPRIRKSGQRRGTRYEYLGEVE